MSKKPKYQGDSSPNERALRELANMKHRDLQRGCIVRGLSPKEVVDFSHPKLANWFLTNYDNSQDENLLITFDDWVEEQLKAKGYKKGDILLSPALRFGNPGNIEEMEKPHKNPSNVQTPLIKPDKKPKAEISQVTGVRAGTKKALTFDLAYSGMDINDIVLNVKKEFPQAEEKSIRIWVKKAIREKSNKNQ